MEEKERASFKTALLSDLKQSGIWLVDASVLGINRLVDATRKQIIRKCWDLRLGQLFEELKAEGLKGVIEGGGSVYGALNPYLDKMKFQVVRVDLPQSHIRGGYWKNYELIYRTCQKYGPHLGHFSGLAIRL